MLDDHETCPTHSEKLPMLAGFQFACREEKIEEGLEGGCPAGHSSSYSGRRDVLRLICYMLDQLEGGRPPSRAED